jgi:hypothetical protein
MFRRFGLQAMVERAQVRGQSMECGAQRFWHRGLALPVVGGSLAEEWVIRHTTYVHFVTTTPKSFGRTLARSEKAGAEPVSRVSRTVSVSEHPRQASVQEWRRCRPHCGTTDCGYCALALNRRLTSAVDATGLPSRRAGL